MTFSVRTLYQVTWEQKEKGGEDIGKGGLINIKDAVPNLRASIIAKDFNEAYAVAKKMHPGREVHAIQVGHPVTVAGE